MTNQHPITPPRELTDKWNNLPLSTEEIFVIAAQWGADRELEACLLWVGDGRRENLSQVIALRTARRPKPPTLKEQALKALLEADGADHPVPVLVLPIEDAVVIRRALESL